MSKDKAKGLAKQAEGKAKEVAGVVSGNRKLEAEGKLKQAEGKGQETVGDVKDEIDKSTKDRAEDERK
ncbi:CsbD family protein [Henriciella sp.]|uniref:CsbD family protein n=1 Tax=Henriciella sp. TaxID=1968823 RepID=UPI00262F182A|nr:CsbD family protein [Henriciella sp.]